MSRLLKNRSSKLGMAPGSVIHVGERKTDKDIIEAIDYNAARLSEKELSRAEACFPLRDNDAVSWINIDGLHDTALIEKLGRHFGIHELVLEDIVNTGQRPKFEDHGDYLFVVMKMLSINGDQRVQAEQLSLLVGKGYVITFQEQEGDVFDPVRNRIRDEKTRIRQLGADYLAYSLVDMIVDHYYVILESIGEKLERLEDDMLDHPEPETLHEVHAAKRDLIFMRKAIWPLREVMAEFRRTESPLIKRGTREFIEDVYDHTLQVLDTVETFRDVIAGLQDIYLSSISNRMNEVMKTLTIIATIFIPLTYIAGIYGMNFEHMPELHWAWGYSAVWVCMIGVAVTMVLYFRRKKWL